MAHEYILTRRAAWPTTIDGRPVLDSEGLTQVARAALTADPDTAFEALNPYMGLDEDEYKGEEGDEALRQELFEALEGELHVLAGQINRAEQSLTFDGRRWWLEVHDLHHESGDYSELLRSVDLVDDSALTIAPVDGDSFVDLVMTSAAMAAVDSITAAAEAALKSAGIEGDALRAAREAMNSLASSPMSLAPAMRQAADAAQSAWFATHHRATPARA